MPALSHWLRDRKLAQWAFAYLAAAWIGYEAISLLAENFAWPPVIIRGITVLLGVGLLVTLVLAWYHGEQGRQRVVASELAILIGLAVLGVAGVGYVSRMTAGESRFDARSPRGDVAGNSIAVLPLESLSDDRDDAYFADGVHEEILTHLASVEGLKVISRTSVLQYRARTGNVREIAQALGVATVLEGSVRRAGGRIRVSAQLIDARTDQHLWAQNYDGEAASCSRSSRRSRARSSALCACASHRRLPRLRPSGRRRIRPRTITTCRQGPITRAPATRAEI